MELAIADGAHIKNKETEDLHKMDTTKQNSAKIEKGKGCVLVSLKNSMRDVYSLQRREKNLTEQNRMGKPVWLYQSARHIQYTHIYDKFR